MLTGKNFKRVSALDSGAACLISLSAKAVPCQRHSIALQASVSPRQRRQYLWLLGLILLCLNACVHQPLELSVSESCGQTLSEWQATRNRSDTRDAQVYSLDDLGVFAINRFLVGLVPKLDTLAGKEFWLRASWRLAQETTAD